MHDGATEITVLECPDCDRQWLPAVPDDLSCACTGADCDGLTVPYTRMGRLPRVWYYPAWQMTRPWKVGPFRGGDEWDRGTLAIQLGPLGCVVVADPRRWKTSSERQP